MHMPSKPVDAGTHAGLHALIVESDAGARNLCRGILESSGFGVDAVESGIAAVVAARRHTPDLILIAPQLTDVPGREAMIWLRANPALRDTPVVVMATREETENGDFQSSAVLRKPLRPSAIRRTIHDIFAS